MSLHIIDHAAKRIFRLEVADSLRYFEPVSSSGHNLDSIPYIIWMMDFYLYKSYNFVVMPMIWFQIVSIFAVFGVATILSWGAPFLRTASDSIFSYLCIS